MLMFRSLALLVKIKLCGGNLCAVIFLVLCTFLPSRAVVFESCSPAGIAELPPDFIVLQDGMERPEYGQIFFNLHFLLLLKASLLSFLVGDFSLDCVVPACNVCFPPWSDRSR